MKRHADKVADTMTIGGLAKAAGVNVETIRYYQRRGLLSEPERLPEVFDAIVPPISTG